MDAKRPRKDLKRNLCPVNYWFAEPANTRNLVLGKLVSDTGKAPSSRNWPNVAPGKLSLRCSSMTNTSAASMSWSATMFAVDIELAY